MVNEKPTAELSPRAATLLKKAQAGVMPRAVDDKEPDVAVLVAVSATEAEGVVCLMKTVAFDEQKFQLIELL